MTTKATTAQAHTEAATTTEQPKTETAAATTTTTKTETPAKTEKETAAASTTTTTTETPAKTEKAQESQTAAPDFTKLVVPDSGKEFIDQLTIDTVVDFAKRSGWSLEDAQHAIDEQAQMLAKADAAYLSQLKADVDYGGDKLADTQKLAKSVIDLVRPEGHPRREAFLRTLNRAAAGNNIEVVSFLADLGKRAAEDSFSAGNTANKGGDRDAASVLYGGTTK